MSTPAPAAQVKEPAQSEPAIPDTNVTKSRTSRAVAMDIVALGDIFAVTLGTQLPAQIYASNGELVASWVTLLQVGMIAGFISHLWFRSAGMYDKDKIADLPHHPAKLLAGTAISIAAVTSITIPMDLHQWHFTIWFASWLLTSFTLIVLSRGIAHAVLARMSAAGRFDRTVAVFGAGAVAKRVNDYLIRSGSSVQFSGVYDDRLGDERTDHSGLPPAGKLEDLLAKAFKGAIDDIIIALPQAADSRISEIARKLEQAPSNIHVVTHIASDLISSDTTHRVSNIGDVGLIDVKDKPLADWSPIIKRTEDIIIASLALVVTLPILITAIIAVKLDSKGPAFYRQRRRGLNRQVIQVLKLRTLSVSDGDDQVRQVTPGDDRVTSVGRILRRTSIDELPQLWNVLKGDMSIVGPRPHALIHDEQFSSMLEDYANRHQVKPGITGLAQVNGLRGETSTPEQIENRLAKDMAYVKSWSLWLDLKIIARTLIIVVTGRNAY